MRASWLPGQAISVIGAAHRRQGRPCQDASLCRQLQSGSEAVQLLAVADGHGGSRYWLSDVGSALACAEAELAVQQALEHTPLADQAAWLALLGSALPGRILRGWLTAIERDWQQRPEAAEQPFSPLSYGCTLGVVLLTPHWWGCSGIGDWDLAAVTTDGTALLLSEERGSSHSGEATGSLCQPQQHQAWGERAQLRPLEGGTVRALVLSSDGVRKSCATDADYLSLCQALIELSDAELEQGLQQITAEGSGDDVSVAMARRAPDERGAVRPRPASAIRGLLGGVLALAIVAAAGLAGWRWLQRPDPLNQLIAELCGNPGTIRPTLQQRRSQFVALLQQPALAERLKAQVHTDPLGALIAGGARGSQRGCASLQLELERQWREVRAAAAPARAKMPATVTPPP